MAGSPASRPSTSPTVTSASLPVHTTCETPTPRSWARSSSSPATPPLWATTAMGPATSGSRKAAPEAITEQRSVALTKPGLLGPITRRPVRSAKAAISRSSAAPSGPVSE